TAVLAGINAVLAAHQRPPTTLDTWRTLLRRPPKHAYEQLLHTPLTDSAFARATRIFDTHSQRTRVTCPLATAARWALREWKAAGNTQSLLSMTPHDELVADIAAKSIHTYFTAVQGRIPTDEPAKAALLREHLTRHNLNPA